MVKGTTPIGVESGHAVYTPDAVQAVKQVAPCTCPETVKDIPVLTSSNGISTPRQQFPCGHLLYPHLTDKSAF